MPGSRRLLDDLGSEFSRYRQIGERALQQTADEHLNSVPVAGGNSPAMIVRHLQGNFTSRFTDFLTSDGEKPWRNRDGEFDEGIRYSRTDVNRLWGSGWQVLENALLALTDEDLARSVTIRGQALTVHAALCRSLSHAAYHVGQLVLLARQSAGGQWDWISIPKGASAEYNRNPDKEKPRR